MTDIRFALAQIDTCVGDLDSNADKVMQYAHRAAQQGAKVVVFPEMTLTGYPIEDLALRATFRKAAWDKANWLATELAADGLDGLYVVVGTVGTDRETSKPRNRLVVLHDGVVWAGYDKHFLPNYGVFDEFRIFTPETNPWCLTWTAPASAWPSARTSGRMAAPWPNSPRNTSTCCSP